MHLGDDLTLEGCWRANIWDNLTYIGLADSVDYVGSVHDETQSCTTGSPNFDIDNEAHSGRLAIDVADDEEELRGWLGAAKPDVVQFMMGMNDVVQNGPTEDIIEAYTKIVGIMREENPNMRIIVRSSFLPLLPKTLTQACLHLHGPTQPVVCKADLERPVRSSPPKRPQPARHRRPERPHPRLGQRRQYDRLANLSGRLLPVCGGVVRHAKGWGSHE